MSEHLRSHGTSFVLAWWIVFLSTIASGVLAVMSLLLTMQARGNALFMPANTSPLSFIAPSLVIGTLVGMVVGALSGAVLAPVLMNRSRRAVLWSILLTSILVGPLSAPFFHVFAAGLVFVGQAIVTIVLGVGLKDLAQVQFLGRECAACGYSLAGLDRAKTGVCPECGAALPVKNEAE